MDPPEHEEGPWGVLLHPSTAARLALVRQGQDVCLRLPLGDLPPGRVGVVDAWIAEVGPIRSFTRRDGREGTMRRVVLRDATGEADLVLWGSDVSGTFTPGAHVRIQAAVREAYRGPGAELSLAGAVTVLDPADEGRSLEGTLTLDDTFPVDDGGHVRFRAEGELATATGTARIVLWDDAIREARAAGAHGRVVVHGMSPHPFLDGHWLPTATTRITPA